MKRLRIVLPAAGLALLTALFFLLPVLWRQRTARNAAKAQVRSVALTEPSALTPEEIADLVSVASDIDGKVQVTTLDAPVREPQYYLDTVTAMLEQICGSPEQSELVAFLEKECLSSSDRIIAFAEYLLVVLEDTPHLLTVVTVQSGDFNMLYEESTGLPIRFEYIGYDGKDPRLLLDDETEKRIRTFYHTYGVEDRLYIPSVNGAATDEELPISLLIGLA